MSTSLSRRGFIRLAAVGSAAGALGWAGHAQVPQPSAAASGRSRSGAEFITRETEEAIRDGLDFLARSQLSQGEFSDRPGVAAGISSLAALALMSGGSQPNRGKYGRELARAVDYIVGLSGAVVPGLLSNTDGLGRQLANTTPGPMYSHGFSTLFLSEVCGMLPDAGRDTKVRTVLEQAVTFIINARNNEGGWRYVPKPEFADVSVTVAQMMALRAAKHAGILVRKEVVDAGARYIKACQMPTDGGFSYWKGTGYSAFARTAAAIVGLYSAGIYEGKEVERGLKYLQQFTPGRQFSSREIPPQYYWYGQYYAALAMWTAGDDYWTAWFPAIRDELLYKRRSSGGMWADPYHGAPYATAMALIILQLPNNYLPILQK